MTKIKVVPLTEETNDKLDDIVGHRQPSSNHRITKKGVIGDLVADAHKKEIKK